MKIGGKNRFMPFPMVLKQNETHIASSRIWTLIAISTAYDNPYTTCIYKVAVKGTLGSVMVNKLV